MAYGQPQAWYVHSGNGSTTGYYAIPAFVPSSVYAPGTLVRQTAPAVGSERVFVSISLSGTAGAEPAWVITKGGRSPATGAIAFQECSGEPGVNGDIVNCLQWTASSTPPIGRIIYDPTTASLQICSISGAGGATKPSFSASPGAGQSDNAANWTSLGLASSFGAFAAPAPRLSIAIAAGWGAVGNDFYIADNSAETATSFTITLGTVTSPCRFMSVDHTASMPPNAAALKPGATFTSTSTTGNSISGAVQSENYFYGCNFVVAGAVPGVGIVFASNVSAHARLEKCTVTLAAGTISTTAISVGSTGAGIVEIINSSFGFSVAGQFIYWSAGFQTWRDTPNPCFTGTIPNTPLHAFQSTPAAVLFEGVDFSAAGSNTLFSTVACGTFFTLKNCKMHTGPVVGAFVTTQAVMQVDLVNCDSGGAIYRNERYTIYGNLQTITALYRTGGAVDAGVPIVHNLVATSFCRPQRPLLGFPLSIWNDTVGSPVTVTIYGALNGTSTRPTNAQLWFDMEYMADSASPISSLASSGLATPLSTAVTYAADAVSTWVGLSGTKALFVMSVTVTPQQKGYFTLYPKAGTSGSVYLDPKPVLS